MQASYDENHDQSIQGVRTSLSTDIVCVHVDLVQKARGEFMIMSRYVKPTEARRVTILKCMNIMVRFLGVLNCKFTRSFTLLYEI